ncbi:MAG: chemotaxis protein CheC [Candidatus Sericytochromatia bacterium]|nr:chemotaxis protein CheC [Candidatus Sericytochromatia bacterium]
MDLAVLAASPMLLDALKEIGNIGASQAATSLSVMVGATIRLEVPEVHVVPINAVADILGGPEKVMVGVYQAMTGEAEGHILFLLPHDRAEYLLSMMLKTEVDITAGIDEMAQSALTEIGNILSSSYMRALSQFCQLTMRLTPPALAIDMAGALIDVILIQLSAAGNLALVIETNFFQGDRALEGYFFILPDPDSLGAIFHSIGIAT